MSGTSTASPTNEDNACGVAPKMRAASVNLY